MSSVDDATIRPLVSVVVPSYNRAQYIVETIQSVLDQSYPNIELIVIDDGSTDNTREIVEAFDSRVRYVWQRNAERGAARNHGLRLSQGKYIAFLDSDDVWLPEKVADDVRVLETDENVGLVHSDAVQIDSDGKEIRLLRSHLRSRNATDQLLRINTVIFSTHVARANLIRQLGGFLEERRLSGSEDWELLVRLSLRSKFAHRRAVTTKIRTHPANTMTDAAAMNRSTKRAAEIFDASPALNAAHARSLRAMHGKVALVNAINYCTKKESRESKNFLKQALTAYPFIILDARFGYTILRLLKLQIVTRMRAGE